MLHIRIVKTKGNSRSVQVYHYQNSKRVTTTTHTLCPKAFE